MERTGLSWTARLAQVGDLYRGGVTLISGGDSGINPAKPHGVLPAALEDLVICGVPAEQALASATGAAARGIGLGHRKGLLRAGYDADLLVVGGNPLADISAIRNARLVVLRGAPID
jgi:imidazolonepropionase-like amidohydrolase